MHSTCHPHSLSSTTPTITAAVLTFLGVIMMCIVAASDSARLGGTNPWRSADQDIQSALKVRTWTLEKYVPITLTGDVAGWKVADADTSVFVVVDTACEREY
jgi:hypothetical protein